MSQCQGIIQSGIKHGKRCTNKAVSSYSIFCKNKIRNFPDEFRENKICWEICVNAYCGHHFGYYYNRNPTRKKKRKSK